MSSKRFRSHRYRPTDLTIDGLQAEYEHFSGQSGPGEVIDFSNQGAAILLNGNSHAYLIGDSFQSLRIFSGDVSFFDGKAIIQNVREDNGRTAVGLAFRNGALDLAKVHDIELRTGLKKRFDTFFEDVASTYRIDDRFASWVSQVKYFLDALKEQLDSEEEQLQDLDEPTRQAITKETLDIAFEGSQQFLTKKVAELNALVENLDSGSHNLYRAFLQHHLLEAFVSESPFFRRCYKKPLGYPGDYEIMNMVYRDHRIGNSFYGKTISAFGCDITASRAVINRIPLLAKRIAESLQATKGNRVASVACGPAREISELIEKYPHIDNYTVTLVDIERRAIQFCEKNLLPQVEASGRNVSLQFVQETVRELVRRKSMEEVLDLQDVIVSVGLFDYFNDRMFERLLGALYRLLRPGGHLLIGNFSPKNDSRFLMEYLMEWFLIHRNEEDLQKLASSLPPEAIVKVESEPIGVNLFLHVEKPEESASNTQPKK